MNSQIKYIILLFAAFSFLMTAPSYAADKYLFDFNEPGASGTTWPGWTWSNDCDGYNRVGWRQSSGAYFPGTTSWYPRTCAKTTDYGTNSTATIDASDRAPSTSTGGSLKVTDPAVSGTYPSWWYLWGYNYSSLGLADSTTNRMDFYLKTTTLKDSGFPSDPHNGNFHIGTYTCWPKGGASGESCPYESGNGHYYHMLAIRGGTDMWMHVLLDRHPSHRRDVGVPSDNPTAPDGYNYYAVLDNLYAEVRYNQGVSTSYWVDELKLWTQTQPENDLSISSVWVGYHTNTGKWEFGWSDLSFVNYNDTTKSTFEIKYSTNPITNANWGSATYITPEYNAGVPANSVKRPNSWKATAWTQFTLPSSVVSGYSKIYFAIKDVSSTANGDGHSSRSANIKTIDYNLRPSSTSGAPSAPKSLIIVK